MQTARSADSSRAKGLAKSGSQHLCIIPTRLGMWLGTGGQSGTLQ